MVEYEVVKKAVFEPHKGYWGQAPALDRLEFIDLGDDMAAAINALASGQVMGMYDASTTQSGALQKIESVAIHTVNTAQTGVARMNPAHRSAEHTSELPSLMRISYAVLCLQKTTKTLIQT